MGFTELELRQGERLLMQGAANKWQTVGSKGGNLFLTDQRIVFKAHAFNFGSKFDEYELSDIQTQGNTVNIKTTSNLISFNITFYTKSGEKLSFVVTRSQKNEWIRQITEAITSLARSRVSVPENIPEVEVQKITAQIKAVQCEGCGAFVIVTAGNAAKCDYCGRPTVG
ncbi:GRAM domain-containing protein [Fibrobacter sp.]|uniref:GRAM domain-containing protein n=1 Tax=Fibrobacter sp. TaxID=35828 RepID=UPI00388F3CAA